MKIKTIRTRIYKEGENLVRFITAHMPRLKEGDVLVVTSKIVALSEKRTAVIKNEKEKEKLIRGESDFAVRTKYVWLTLKDNMWMANAGIDESNVHPVGGGTDGKVVLLPKDSYAAAARLRKKLQKIYRVKKFGVVITDSRTMPLRAGVTGVALGYAGFRGLRDYRGKPDIFGRKLVFTRTNVADGLAAAAVLVMGEGEERQPLAIIEQAPVEFCERVARTEVLVDPKEDMYALWFGG